MLHPYYDGLQEDYQRLVRSFVKTYNLRPDYTQSVFPGEWAGAILTRSVGSSRRIGQGVEIKTFGFDLLFHVGTREWPGGIEILTTIDHKLGEWIDNCEETTFLRNLKIDDRPIECAASQLLVDPHTWRLDVTASASATFAVRRTRDGAYIPFETTQNGN